MKTKDKILLTARKMFNEQGFGNVSLANLADELGIAKGNVWYHFNDKSALLSGINDQYLEFSAPRRDMQPDPDNISESYVAFIHVVAAEIREFRFMFRDQAEYGAHDEKFQKALPGFYAWNFKKFTDYYNVMRTANVLRISDEDVKDLVHNAILVLRHNISFEREVSGPRANLTGSVQRSFLQHLTLFKPYMPQNEYKNLVAAFTNATGKDLKWAV